jgi:hypothetical protein
LASHSELPPTHTIKRVDPPPPSSDPTVAMLKGDIDSGQTGDKNPVLDPSLAPLGTDDEAAGHPPSPVQVALARHYENIERWIKGGWKSSAAHNKQDGMPVAFIAFIVGVGVIIVTGMSAF